MSATENAAEARLLAHSVATSILLGIVLDEIEALHPGSRDRIKSRIGEKIDRLAALGKTPAAIAEEVKALAHGVIDASSI